MYIYRHIYIERDRGSYFKELTHAIVGDEESKISRVGWQSGGQGRASFAAVVQRQTGGRIPSPSPSVFFC